MISAIKGFKDILPGEIAKWHYVEEKARSLFSAFGVREIRTPILEKTILFQRGIGSTTDIVEKEMYTFRDLDDEYLSMRPEATASIIRSYVEHKLYATDPIAKLYTIGPMFRRERPQKGRYRQFHQLNVEFLGLDDPRSDGEIILLLLSFLQAVGLSDLRLEINSLGCPQCRPSYRTEMLRFLKDKDRNLCADCLRRLETNPLRVLDCKVEDCRNIIEDAPRLLDFLCPSCSDHFESVRLALEGFNLLYRINHGMVRGLDYYRKTAFEVTTDLLGAQNAVAGGGRYDGLVHQLDGPDVAGIGFAVGMERLIALLSLREEDLSESPLLYMAALGDEAADLAYMLCNKLRLKGLRVERSEETRSLKSQMKKADKLGCRYVLILGEEELHDGRATLREMAASSQESIAIEGLEETLISRIAKR